jgi:DNA-binding Xre family transcriptional regulator
MKGFSADGVAGKLPVAREPEARRSVADAEEALGSPRSVMKRRKITQVKLAKAMRTSRTVVHRLLDPHDTSVTLATLAKASKALGVKLVQVA